MKGLAKSVYGVGKAGARTFLKASELTGKMVVGSAKMVANGISNIRNLHQKGKLKQAIVTFAPAQIFLKIGWKAVKFIGRKIWSGIKKLVFKASSLFGGLFRIGGKFVNKVQSWKDRLVKGIKDKKYRFLVEPISNMMVSVFKFLTGVVMSPINFMKWLVPTVFDRIRDALHNI